MLNSNISKKAEINRNLIFVNLSNNWLSCIKPSLKVSSYVKYQNILNKYVLPYFAERRIDEIKRSEIISFIETLLAEGGSKKTGLSQSTVNCVVSVLKGIYLYAEQCGFDCTVPNLNNLTIKKSQRKLRVLSTGEQLKLSKYLSEKHSPKDAGILLCLYTGIRIGEICALKWEDISFEDNCLIISKTIQRLQVTNADFKTSVITTSPKSVSSERMVPVPDNMMRIIIEFKSPGNTYFLSGTEKCVEPRTMQNYFKSALNECGINNANFHSLRHTFATRCIELGFDVKSLSEILGHSSVNITMNRYVHPSMELKQQNMNKLSNLLNFNDSAV